MKAQIQGSPRKYGTAIDRWAGVGPYYAMFPTAFADAVVEEYTKPGDIVLDPFAGRGTAIFSAAAQDRPAIGIEINPLGFVYANAKLKTGNRQDVISQLDYLAEISPRYGKEASELPEFFHCCFSEKTREFLIAAQQNLDWKRTNVDRTLMALILISLHGKSRQSLSNQMRQTSAMSPAYCIRWWHEKGLYPPDIDPIALIRKRIEWRYVHGKPQIRNATVRLGDSIQNLPRLNQEIKESKRSKAKLLITSPPYHNVTNYYYDQWLRLWMLGGPQHPNAHTSNKYGGKFSNNYTYRQLLDQVFAKSKSLIRDDAVVYVRTDRRESTYRNTLESLTQIFPEKSIREVDRPLLSEQQTKPYSRGGAPKRANCEIDLILEPC